MRRDAADAPGILRRDARGRNVVEQIAQPAVHHARRCARRARAPVLALEYRHAQPAQRRIARDPDPIDTAADDQYIQHGAG
jgi:hypothetical protein